MLGLQTTVSTIFTAIGNIFNDLNSTKVLSFATAEIGTLTLVFNLVRTKNIWFNAKDLICQLNSQTFITG